MAVRKLTAKSVKGALYVNTINLKTPVKNATLGSINAKSVINVTVQSTY
jgi:hypothetical protein